MAIKMHNAENVEFKFFRLRRHLKSWIVELRKVHIKDLSECAVTIGANVRKLDTVTSTEIYLL